MKKRTGRLHRTEITRCKHKHSYESIEEQHSGRDTCTPAEIPEAFGRLAKSEFTRLLKDIYATGE